MNLALFGYGSMGHEIEVVARERGHAVVLRVDPAAEPTPTAARGTGAAAGGGGADTQGVVVNTLGDTSELRDVDCVIEFARGEGVLENVRLYAAAGVPAVVGTTGWEDQREAVRAEVEQAHGAYLYGANFSVGAHVFFHVVEAAARALNAIDAYDVAVTETHHNRKADSPSGTALAIAERILASIDRKTSLQTATLHRPIEKEELHVGSTRVGSVPGIHRVLFDSPADSIEISHSARSRAGFALGAVLAAEWLPGRTGFFTVDEFMAGLLGSNTS